MSENKEPTKTEEYFDLVAVDDIDELLAIGEMAITVVHEKLKIKLGTPKVPIAIYSVIFECILKYLKSQQKKRESLRIVMANRIEIGFTTSFDTEENMDLEKMGNFMIYMLHINNEKKTEFESAEEKSLDRCVQWNESNNTTSLTDIKEITKLAKDDIQNKLGIISINAEVVLPLFCLIHDCIVNFVTITRNETKKFEYRINVTGCYDIFARLLETGVDISYKPCVYEKGFIKEDGDATTKYES